jgi:predicted 2-oxoglutarate/Fe(II)-dependent dioxygenase YbiX
MSPLPPPPHRARKGAFLGNVKQTLKLDSLSVYSHGNAKYMMAKKFAHLAALLNQRAKRPLENYVTTPFYQSHFDQNVTSPILAHSIAAWK